MPVVDGLKVIAKKTVFLNVLNRQNLIGCSIWLSTPTVYAGQMLRFGPIPSFSSTSHGLAWLYQSRAITSMKKVVTGLGRKENRGEGPRCKVVRRGYIKELQSLLRNVF